MGTLDIYQGGWALLEPIPTITFSLQQFAFTPLHLVAVSTQHFASTYLQFLFTLLHVWMLTSGILSHLCFSHSAWRMGKDSTSPSLCMADHSLNTLE